MNNSDWYKMCIYIYIYGILLWDNHLYNGIIYHNSDYNTYNMCIYVYILVGGFEPPLWKMMEFVSWDDDIPN